MVSTGESANVTQMEVIERQAWNFAKSPTSQIPMFLFIFWMTGSSLSIYTIMFTMQFAMTPFKSIFNIQTAFEPFEHKGLNTTLPKLVYIAANMVTIGLATYKFSNVGIVPVQPDGEL